MLTQDALMDLFRSSGALLEGHFLLASGRHASRYVQCALVLQYPAYAEVLGSQLAAFFRSREVSAVLGPALGGIVVAHEVARALGARAVFAEREGGRLTLRRGFALSVGEPVVVVEDVLTTGGSALETIRLAESLGAKVVGVGALVDRSGGRLDLGRPYHALLTLDMPSYEPSDCPLCREGVGLVSPGTKARQT
ncbi:MAG: orotate phosphoribosyltransferase [Moorellales bacterium]